MGFLILSQPSWGQDETQSSAGVESAVIALDATTTPPVAADVSQAYAPNLMSLEQMVEKLWTGADTVWVLVCAMLVFFMNLGFGCVETGFARSKNCVNILSKNFIVFAATSVAYWLLGWDLMFGSGDGAWIGNSGSWGVGGGDNSPFMGDRYQGVYSAISWTHVPLWAKFFFQLVFAGTAATIVSGAVAERIRYHAFIIFSFVMALAIYPVVGHWIWGFGYLAKEWNFWDFAGCSVVHSVGGWSALTGALILGPRIGKYGSDGKVRAIPGHNMTAAFIGCFVLWFGWFGFNPGSTMGVAGDGGALAALVAVNTNAAAAAATLTATATAWILLGKPDIGMTLNGCLAGLVSITACAAYTSVPCSLIIGAIAGVLVIMSVLFFDRIHIDDPVGATSVHLVCGIFGTLCVGLFTVADLSGTVLNTPFGTAAAGGPYAGLFFGGGAKQLIAQLVGVLLVGAYVVPVSAIAWLIIKATVGLRVSPQDEIEGLDICEHGNEAYHGFVMVRNE
ncbi:MAG: ammonium transporter [Planctomycetota bacterium]|nr:MAG: ammonium transporter [Planctomycetota bacterium]RLS55546.1 MAG: ammonium transporter [Planctomycetota bacterium]